MNSRLLSVFWGLVCLAFSFYVGDISQTIIESVNKIGSLINGPLLAVFLMGILSARVNGPGAIFGLVVGFFGNLWLWKFAPDISWMWWNIIGFFVAYASGYVMSLMFATPETSKLATTTYISPGPQRSESQIKWRVYYAILALYGTGILIFLIILTRAF